MGALCDDCPKPMLPINGKPKLAYSIETLPEEISEVVLIVGYLKESVMGFFGDEYAGKSVRYVVHETIDGTGKVMHSAKDVLGERFLVTMGDDLYRQDDLEELLSYDIAVLAKEVEDAGKWAVLETDGKGNLEKIVEAPHDSKSRLVNTAAYMLTKEYFDYPLVPKSPGSREFGLPQTMLGMRDKHDIAVVRARDWFPIGDPSALAEAQTRIRDFISS